MYVNVFNNYEGEISFDYENVPLTQVDRIDNTLYRLYIDKSVEKGTLTVYNEEGCRLEEEINLEIGEPNFTFS